MANASALRIPSSVEDEECEHHGYHRHQCPHCGYVWKHADSIMAACSPEEGQEGHTCPRCGEEQYWKFPYGPEPEDVMREQLLASLQALFFGD